MLDEMTNVLEGLDVTLTLFQKVRDAMPQDEWDKLIDHPQMGLLLCSLSDLEDYVGK